MTHHPHVHMIVPGGGISPGGDEWIACKPSFFLPVRVLSRLFRRLFLSMLIAAHETGQLKFHGDHIPLSEPQAFADWLAPLRKCEWVVYAKPPFAGPKSVLAYLSRYTHRVAISNSRLFKFEGGQVSFKWKDYRAKLRCRQKIMTLSADEFIRRFLIHVLPHGFHRIRHYGLFANGHRARKIALCRKLLDMPACNDKLDESGDDKDSAGDLPPSPCCGGRMVIIECFERGAKPRAPPTATMQRAFA